MNTLDRFFRRKPYYQHKDRSQPADLFTKYGTSEVAKRRFPQTDYDILAQNYNANVRVCHRAIGEAVRSLPLQIVSLEQVDNGINEVIDFDHEANSLIKHPNPKMTLSEVLHHNTDSYLGDGNAYVSMEFVTGPNSNIELWPRDPRNVERILNNSVPRGYKVGRLGKYTIKYNESRMIHVRNMDVSDPLYGKPRHEAVRDEIQLDNLVNQFNKKFFENGATFSMMFSPLKNLTEAQHKEMLIAIKQEMTGMENAFGLVINRFAGKIEGQGQKHSEVAFLELLRMNREKIYAAFGLPPFRGGVMEYANYANALAQDKDFWLNTIKPIVTVILDAYNKQMIWPLYGDDIMLQANYSAIPALKGTPKDQAEVHEIYLSTPQPVITVDEVREQLGFDPMPEDEKRKQEAIRADDAKESTEAKEMKQQNADAKNVKGVKADKKQTNAVATSLYHVLRKQRSQLMKKLDDFTARGSVLCVFMNAQRESETLYDLTHSNQMAYNSVLPSLSNTLRHSGTRLYRECALGGVFKPTKKQLRSADKSLEMHLYRMNEDTQEMLRGILHDADKRNLNYHEIRKQVGTLFTLKRARSYSGPVTETLFSQIGSIVHSQLASQSTTLIATRTRKESVS